jgi:protein-S-isoprenylcysteine O-methyltransferase Ste14
MKLVLQTLVASFFGLVFFGVVLFLPAGTFDYWQAWVFIAVFTVATLVPSFYLAVKDPAALARRMHAGPTAETRPIQRLIIAGTYLAVVLLGVVSALDHRFGWSSVPLAIVLLGDLLVVAGLTLSQFVVIQNSYAAATITIESDQKLVTTGLYGLVRHPLYTGAVVMLIGTPLALDSYWGLLVVALTLPLLVARIFDEEKMLTEELAGYREYCAEQPYRLVPHVW